MASESRGPATPAPLRAERRVGGSERSGGRRRATPRRYPLRAAASIRVALVALCAGVFAGAVRTASASAAPDSAPDGDRIELRANAVPLEGRITGVGDGGISIVDATGATRSISWDRVRSVESPQWQRDADRRLEMATDLWRARTRIERGDTEAAEALLDAHASLMRSSRSETAMVVAEGLLRCRLARGEHALAIEPAIRTASLRRAGVTTTAYALLRPLIDPATGLVPQLPPVVLRGPAVATMRSAMDDLMDGNDPIAAEVASLYRLSAVVNEDATILPLHLSGDRTPPASAPGDPGASILRAMLATMSPDADERREARRRLTDSTVAGLHQSGSPRSGSPVSWTAAWTAFFVGASSLIDDDSRQRRRGIVSLLRVPAESVRRRPWLAGVALAVAARALDAEGDAVGAALLRREFETDHPYHPHRPLRPFRPASPRQRPSSPSSSRPPEHPA